MFVQIKKRWEGDRKSEYATHSDFRTIFIEHVQRLYLLALLLTGDHPTAERCFVAAFALCAEGSCVFKDWATSWSSRSVIKNAIRMTSPAPALESRPDLIRNHNELNFVSSSLLKSLQELPPFDRFVFVISVLERYSDRECSALLSCAVTDILPTRIRAMQQLSMIDESKPSTYSTRGPYNIDADWLECG